MKAGGEANFGGFWIWTRLGGDQPRSRFGWSVTVTFWTATTSQDSRRGQGARDPGLGGGGPGG